MRFYRIKISRMVSGAIKTYVHHAEAEAGSLPFDFQDDRLFDTRGVRRVCLEPINEATYVRATRAD